MDLHSSKIPYLLGEENIRKLGLKLEKEIKGFGLEKEVNGLGEMFLMKGMMKVGSY